jgi:2-dehydro-3-deoxy-D-pentonate aldolase
MAKLHGIYTPNMVPLDSQGRIDEPAFRRYIDWLIEHGIHGLYPNGSTGEFTRFTVEEKRRIIKIACEQCKGRVPVLAGAAEANVKETVAACEIYKEYGATAVAIVSPFYYRLSQPAVYAYFREIGLHSPIDVTLYNIPMFASPIEVPTIQRLAEIPRIVGIKDSSGDISFMMRMMGAVKPHRPDFVFFTGWDAALVPMLLMGCDGGVHATSGVVPEVTRKLYDLTRAGKIEEARGLQLRLIKAFDAMMYGFDFPEGIRMAVEARVIALGPSRQPQGDGKIVDTAALKRQIESLLSGA